MRVHTLACAACHRAHNHVYRRTAPATSRTACVAPPARLCSECVVVVNTACENNVRGQPMHRVMHNLDGYYVSALAAMEWVRVREHRVCGGEKK